MSWAAELKILGVTSNGLIAGNEASEADYGSITVVGDGANEGRLNDGEIRTGGNLYISSGGVANGTVQKSGNFRLYSGAVANLTTVSSGQMHINANAVVNGTVFSRGVVTVSRGGTANETTLYGNANTMLVISSGGAASGSILYGGALFLRDGVANGTIMSNGTVYVSSGGAANSISVNNGTVNISDGGIASDTTIKGGKSDIGAGGITVDISGAASVGTIFAGALQAGTAAALTVAGDTSLTIDGTASVGYVSGEGWANFDTVTGKSTLIFDDYVGINAGEFTGRVENFDEVWFDGEAESTIKLSGKVSNVGSWGFDVVGREAYADTALLEFGSGNGFGGGNIDLRIADDSASETTWSLATLSGDADVGTFSVYLGSSTEAYASGVALDTKLGGTGTFAGYGFTVDGNTLKFGLLSA